MTNLCHEVDELASNQGDSSKRSTWNSDADSLEVAFRELNKHRMGDCGGSKTVTLGAQTNDDFPILEEEDKQLLPGIANEITLHHICTKLPWEAFYILSSVSRFWLQAIRSHRVHEVRVRSCKAETLIVHLHDHSEVGARIALYSMKDRYCIELPPIPRFSRGIPWSCQCVSIDGKIFVLGGGPEHGVSDICDGPGDGKEVYALDLVGQRQWKRCARMETGRYKFGSGAINGKIYVFGGALESTPVRGCEVYDPNRNAWSPSMPMTSLRFGHRVMTLGEELLVHGGQYFDPRKLAQEGKLGSYSYRQHDYRGRTGSVHDRWLTGSVHYRGRTVPVQDASFLEVYHPVKDDWKVVDPFLDHHSRCVFVARGKVHLMTQDSISVYDTDSCSWKDLHLNSFADFGAIDSLTVKPRAAVAVNDVLVARVYWYKNIDSRVNGACLLEGKGFGTESEVIAWQFVSDCPSSVEDFMYRIQL